MKKNKEYFDTRLLAKELDDVRAKIKEIISNNPNTKKTYNNIVKAFTGERSPEYYLGFLSAMRMMTVIYMDTQMYGPNPVLDTIICASVGASLDLYDYSVKNSH